MRGALHIVAFGAIILAAVMFGNAVAAVAGAGDATSTAASLNLTAVLNTLIGGAFTVIAAVAVAFVNSHVKDQQAAAAIDKAITDSLGALQQAGQGAVTALNPQLQVPVAYAGLAPAIQHVLDNAGDYADRLGLTTTNIAQRIEAQLGILNIQHNLAVAANATPATPHPLAAVPYTAPHAPPPAAQPREFLT